MSLALVIVYVMAEKKSTSQRVAENIIKTHGREKFLFLINQFSSGASGPSIAKEFNVTRQRVNQWKRKLGVEHIQYVLQPEVEKIVVGGTSAATTRTTI